MQNLKFKRIFNYQCGQSLFELVVAIAISALIVVAMVSLATNSIKNSNFSKNKALASSYAQEATEWLRGQRDKDFDAFKNHADIPVWCLKDISSDLQGWGHQGTCGNSDFIAGTPFKRQVTFSTTFENGKDVIEADVTVFWTDSQGFHEATSATNLSNWK